MKEVVRRQLQADLDKLIEILASIDQHDPKELEQLSNHSISDIAVHRDVDIISMSVLLYSISKIYPCLIASEHLESLRIELTKAKNAIVEKNLGKYNAAIKAAFTLISKCNSNTKQYLQDVMQAARIKKGTALLEHGLSMGQAAGLMGLSNWDLQEYASKTTATNGHTESMPAFKRLQNALKIFGVKK